MTTPPPPYYAVIFTSQHISVDEGYGDTAERMVALATEQPGYLAVQSARGVDGLGLTVSHWRSLEEIAAWRKHAVYTHAPNDDRARWYRPRQA